MSAPPLFTARFRWAILQQMRDEISEVDPLDPIFDDLVAAVLETVWGTASKRATPTALDPGQIDLFQVRNLTRRALGVIRAKLPPAGQGGGP